MRTQTLTTDSLNTNLLLKTLVAFKKGDFSVRLPGEWTGEAGVSDIGMPNEDGYSLITRLRKLKTKRAKEMPAIALTAYATKEDRERTRSSGFQVHVAKPIDPEKLITSIAKAMGSKV